MKELWKKLLEIAGIEHVEPVPYLGLSRQMKRWEFNACFKKSTAVSALLFKEGGGDKIVDVLSYNEPKPESLIVKSLQDSSSIVVLKFYPNAGYEEVTVIPRVRNIEELKIYVDLHENRV